MKIRFTRRACLLIAAVMLAVALGGCFMVVRDTTVGGTPPSTGFMESSGSTGLHTTSATHTWASVTSTPESGTVPATVPPTTAVPTTVPPTTVPPTTVPPTTVPETTAPRPTEPLPKLTADTAFVYDSRSGEYLYLSCDANAAVYPASVTKLFTTYVALYYLELDKVVTVGNELNYVIADASVAGFCRGDKVTVEDLAYASLLVSGCDASYTLAAAAGRVILDDADAYASVAIDAFMDQVNRMAYVWGMDNTNFVTPDGNHSSKHYISVQAYVTIARLCMEDADMARIAGTYSKTIYYTSAGGTRKFMELKNSNENLNPNNSAFYRENTLGLKTGYTSRAGGCFLGTYAVEDGYLIIGVFGCPDRTSRFTNSTALLDYYMKYLQ